MRMWWTGMLLFPLLATAQEKTSFTVDSIDATYGITYYLRYNPLIGKGETRMCDNSIPCDGFVTDLYASGEQLHKGFYTQGQLVTYTNYYPDGTTERTFKRKDTYRCVLKTYHSNGNLRTETLYNDGNPVEYTEYYANGNQSFYEKYDKRYTYYQEQSSWQENGMLEFSLELEKKSEKRYLKKEYHPNGKLKAEGPVLFNEVLATYNRNGWWMIYNEAGSPLRKEEYSNGKVVETVPL